MSRRLPQQNERRLVVLTGARQTGKSTLAKNVYRNLRYFNLDSEEERDSLINLRTAAWARTAGNAVIDEAQKAPEVFNKIKYAYDNESVSFSVLLGSSRLLLLDNVRETLAGRAFIYDLWPLMPSEVRFKQNEEVQVPLFDEIITCHEPLEKLLEEKAQFLDAGEEDARLNAVEHLLYWGGMPELLVLNYEDRRQWLRSYQRTFLERDLADIAKLDDVRPFRTLQQLAMLRSGRILSYSELGRDAQVSVSTARRYLEYLDLTYQTILLKPFRRNLTSAAVKTPKLYWADIGLLRQGTGQWGDADGFLFETFVVAECHKWLDTMAKEAKLSFYRTRSGLEVDLLIQTQAGIMGVEIKNRGTVHRADMKSLRAVAAALGREWLGGMVVYRGRDLIPVDEDNDVWAVPVHRLF